MMREIPGFSVYICSYQYMMDMMVGGQAVVAEAHAKGEELPKCSARGMLLAGGISGVLSWIINIPFDIVKSRMQFDDLRNPRYRNTLHCAMESYRNEGLTVFWRGLPVACMRAFPTNAVTFTVYTMTLQAFQNVHPRPRPEDGPTIYD